MQYYIQYVLCKVKHSVRVNERENNHTDSITGTVVNLTTSCAFQYILKYIQHNSQLEKNTTVVIYIYLEELLCKYCLLFISIETTTDTKSSHTI